MSNVIAILKKEIKSYFNSAIAYISIIVFSLFLSSLFMSQFFIIGRSEMRYFFALMPLILCVFVPAIAMRIWAEDKRGNTFELLLTFPMRAGEIVAGKYLAGLVFYLLAILATLPLAIMVFALGDPDPGPIIGGYIGTFFIGAFFLSIGMFVSGMCRDQINALIIGMLICIAFYLVGTEFIAMSIDGWIGGFGTSLKKYFGLLDHYAGFERGVIELADVAFFAIGTTVFLFLNGLYVNRRMRPKAQWTFILISALAAFAVVLSNVFLGNVSLGRYDLTVSKAYTVSPVTKKLLTGLDNPITVKLYISSKDKMPTGMKSLEQDISDKLSELKKISNGKLSYKIFHPEAAKLAQKAKEGDDASLEISLAQKGIQPLQISSLEADEVGVKLVYSAVAITYKNRPDEIIPRIGPNDLAGLEYALASKIYRLIKNRKMKIALFAPFSEAQTDPNLKSIMDQLGMDLPASQVIDEYRMLPALLEYEGYEVSRIKITKDDPIARDTDVLVVIQPEGLSDRQIYEINRYLVEGGSLVIAHQRYGFDYLPVEGSISVRAKKLDSNLDPVLSHWGIDISPKILMDNNNEIMNMSSTVYGLLPVSTPVKTPVQITVLQEGMNEDVSITSGLSPIMYLWGSALRIDPKKFARGNISHHILLASSKESWELDFKKTTLKPEDQQPPEEGFTGRMPLAVIARGQFPDAFGGESVPEWPKDIKAVIDSEESEPEIPEKLPSVVPSAGQLVVFGSSSIFNANLFEIESHRALFINTIDALTLGEDLISLRSRRTVDRMFGKISPRKKVIWKFTCTFFVPLIFIFAGSIRLLLRRKIKLKPYPG